jgi:hypothetical protein
MDFNFNYIWFVLAVFIFFPVFWASILFLLAKMSGWSRLARYYAARGQFEGHLLKWQSGYLRIFTNYNRVLAYGANTNGLFVEVMPFFRPGHAALFIPWTDIEAQRSSFLGGSAVKLSFKQVPGITWRLSDKVFKELTQIANVTYAIKG